MAIEVTVAGLALDEKSRAPIVVLKNGSGELVLPIVIGVVEASAIAAQLEGVDFPRPLAHDLMVSLIRELGGVLEEVEVTDLLNDTFYALLRLRVGERQVAVDARPSDSIALALRTQARITVHERVFAKTSPKAPVESRGEGDNMWQQVLEEMDDDDFGKYKM